MSQATTIPEQHAENYGLFTYPLHGTDRTFYYRPATSDEGVIQQIFRDKVYDLDRLRRGAEIKELALKIKTLGKKPLVIDGGANIGASPIYFTDVFPDAHVVGVEPESGNLQILKKNFEGLSIEYVEAALSSEKGQFQVIDTRGGHWTYRTVPVDVTRPSMQIVNRVTMNELYKEHSKYQPFIVKLDIEGGEQDLFSANTEWVAATPIIMIELHDWILTKRAISRSFLQCVSALDRDFVYIGEIIFSIANNLDALIESA